MRSPFKFLDSYSLKDKDAFFGRKKETDVFYEMVNKNRLLLVYGQSGSGKTSLVECGLANRFDVTDWYPIRVRRRQNINESLRERLQAVLIDEEEDYDLPETLTEQIEDIYAEYLRPVYLIFDQLEEVFILGDKAEQEQFIQSIADLFHSKIACRVIFILREEYLGHLYDFEKVIPTLFDRRLRVEVMNNTKVQTVLQKSFAKFNISLEAPAEDRLREMIVNISGGKALIQLPYLQVYLDMLYREDYQRTYGEKERGDELPPLEFTQTEIAEFGEIEEVLSKFLDFQEKEIQGILSAQYPDLLEHTVLQIMDAYVTDEGTKRPLAYTRIDGLVTVEEKVRRLFPPVSDEILSDCFIELEKARIIRMLDDYMELAHDSLAALLTQKRGAEQQLRKRLSAALQEYELSGGKQLLAETQLLGMAEMLPKLYLDEATHALIEKSKVSVAITKQKEKEKQQRELQLVQDKLASEEKARKRQNRLSALLGVAFLIAMGIGWWAFQQRNEAILAQKEAATNLKKAEENEQLANKNLNTAKLEKAKADSLVIVANREIEKAQESAAAEKEALDKSTKAEREAKAALLNLQKANSESVKIILIEADRNILQLDYEAAFEKTQAAYTLGANRIESKKRLQEIALVYTETNQWGKADTCLKVLDILIKDTIRNLYLEKIKAVNSNHFNHLQKRYYPEMVLVEGGICDLDEDSQAQLDNFYLAKTETTNWQYYLFAKAKNREMTPPSWQIWGDNPVVYVSWYDATEYMNWLSEKTDKGKAYHISDLEENTNLDYWHKDKKWLWDTLSTGYRLPTEAEWEYVAKGGKHHQQNKFKDAGSDTLKVVGWYIENSNLRTQPVAEKKPNSLGLYDMSGNVLEWCWDRKNSYKTGKKMNPKGLKTGPFRVLRGGSWYNSAEIYEVSVRYYDFPSDRGNNYGFRIAHSQ